MPSAYECEVCDVKYVEVRATFIEAKGNDTSVTVGVARDATGEITQICTARSRHGAQRIIFDDWGYGQLHAIHGLNQIVDTNKSPDAFVCYRLVNVWRLPPYVWRDDMDADQEIVVTIGRWLGSRGTATKDVWGDGIYHLLLKLSETESLRQDAKRGAFGWTFRGDDKTNLESVLPRKLRFTNGELVRFPGGLTCHIVTLGIDPNGNEIRKARPLTGGEDLDITPEVRPLTEAERQEWMASVLDD